MILRPNNEIFCRVYVSTGNACEAYRQSRDTSKTNYKHLRERAYELLRQDSIKKRIEELLEEYNKRYDIDSDKLKKEITKQMLDILKNNPKSAFKENEETGEEEEMKISEMSDSSSNAIKKIVRADGRSTYEFHDKIKAAERLARMYGLDEPAKSELNIQKGTDLSDVDIVI